MPYYNIHALAQKAIKDEEEKEKRRIAAEQASRQAAQNTSSSGDMRSRTVEMNRERATVDDSYTPAGTSRTAVDALKNGSYKSVTSERSSESVYDALIDGTYQIRKPEKKKSDIPSPLPGYRPNTQLPAVKKTFAEDVATRQATPLPMVQTSSQSALGLPSAKPASGTEILKKPVDPHTPANYDYLEKDAQRLMAEYSNNILRAQSNPELNLNYTPEQRAADIEYYTKAYQDEENHLKQIRSERRDANTYTAAKSASDFAQKAAEGSKKNSPVSATDLYKDELLSPKLYAPKPTVSTGRIAGTDTKYLMMTDEEKNIYNYYLAKGYKKTAEEYLKSIDNDLQERVGKEFSDRIVKDENVIRKNINTVKAAGTAGFKSGIRGIGEAFDKGVLLDDNPYVKDANQQIYDQLRSQTTGITGAVSDLAYSAGNMLPSVAVGAINPLAGAATMAVSSGGDAYAQARREGKSDDEASKYAVMEGIKEGALQYLLGGIDKVGKLGASKLLSKIPALKNAAKTVGRVAGKVKISPTFKAALKTAAQYGARMGDEATEEYLQSVLEPAIRNVAFNENNEFRPFSEDALYSAALGAASAGLMNLPSLPGTFKGNRIDAKLNAYNSAVREYNDAIKNETLHSLPNVAKEETARPLRVGQATTIYNPYDGKVPEKSDNYISNIVSVGKDSVKRAQQNIDYATMSNVKSPRSALKEIYNKWFDGRKGQNSIVINGVTFDNKPYAVSLNKTAIGKVISDPKFSTEKIATFDAIDDIVSNGEYIGSGKYIQKGTKKKLTERFDYFETKANIGGKDYIVAFDVEVFPNSNNYRTHKINKIELNPVLSADVMAPNINADLGPVPSANAKNLVPTSSISPLSSDVNSKILPSLTDADVPLIGVSAPNAFDSSSVDITNMPERDFIPLPDVAPATDSTTDAASRKANFARLENGMIQKGETYTPYGESEPIPLPDAPRQKTSDSLAGWVNDKTDEQNAQAEKNALATQNMPFLLETPRQKKSFKQKLGELKSEVRRKLIDAGDAVREVGKIAKDGHLYSYYNNARQAQAAGQHMVTKAQSDIRGKKVGKSLNEIFAPVKNKGEQYQIDFNEFLLHRHNIDRVAQYKPIDFSEDFELPKSQAIVERQLRNHPEFAKLADEIYNFNKNLLQYRVDSGLITQKFADEMNEKYPHYVPTHRQFEKDADYFPINTISEEVARVGTGINTAKGGPGDILPIYDQMSKAAVQTVSQAKRNIFANRLADAVYNDPMAMGAWANMPKDADGIYNLDDLKGDSLKDNLLVYHRNGTTEVMELGRQMMEAVRELTNQGHEKTKIEQSFRKVNAAYKSLITEYNPLFTARNFARDIPDALFASKNTTAFVKNLPAAVNEMRKGGELWQQFEALGGTESSFFDYDYNSGTFKKQSWLKRNTIGKISEINRFVEMIPRFTEFYATVKNGDGSYNNLMDAVHNAADITVNFQRGGSWVKPLNSTVLPYFNASIQGLDKNIRTFTETSGGKAWARLITKAAIFGFAPKLINEFILGDDEEYKELKAHDKLNNFIIKCGENQFVKIPQGRLTGVLGSLSAATLKAIRGGEVDIGELALNALSQVGPVNPLEQNIIAPFKNTMDNRTWYGGEIESQRLQELPVVERYDSKTSEIGKAVSHAINGAFGLSPKKIDNLIDSYTGVIGDTLLPIFTNPDGKDVDASTRVKDMAYKAFISPAEKSFMINGNVSNDISSRYYEKVGELSQKANGESATQEDVLVKKYFGSSNGRLQDLHSRMREVESDGNYDLFTRKSMVENIQQEINSVQRGILSNEERYRNTAQKYHTEKPEVAYLYTNRDILGANRALEMEGKTTYAQAQKAVENGASYDNYVEYMGKIDSLPDSIKDDNEKYNAEKSKIIRAIKWNDNDRYILSTMSESKQKKYGGVKSKFNNLSTVRYHEVVEGYNKIEGVKNSDGKTITGTKKANQIKYLQSMGFNYNGAVLFRKIMESN